MNTKLPPYDNRGNSEASSRRNTDSAATDGKDAAFEYEAKLERLRKLANQLNPDDLRYVLALCERLREQRKNLG